MLQVAEHPWRLPRVAFIDKYGTASQQVTMTLQGQIEGSIEKRVPRAYESSQRLALG